MRRSLHPSRHISARRPPWQRCCHRSRWSRSLCGSWHTVIAAETLYIGTIDAVRVRLAEVFRSAVRQNAAAIALAHSQPSGNPTPLPEDVRLTQEVLAAERLLGIAVVDHLVAGSRWMSLRERMP